MKVAAPQNLPGDHRTSLPDDGTLAEFEKLIDDTGMLDEVAPPDGSQPEPKKKPAPKAAASAEDPKPVAPKAAEGDEPKEPEAGAEPKEPEAEAAKEPDADAEKKKAEGEEPEADPDDDKEPEPDEKTIETLTDLSAALGAEHDAFLGHIQVRDGVTLADVIQRYDQGEPEQIRARSAEFDAKETARGKEHDDKLGHLQGLTVRLLDQMDGEKQRTPAEWKELEEENPTQFLIEREKVRDRRDAMAASIEHMKIEGAKRETIEQEARDAFRTAEAAKLVDAVPDWKDEGKAKSAMTDVQTYLRTQGFSDEDLEGLEDHRIVLVAYDAMRYHQVQRKAPVSRKRVALTLKAPIKAGARTDAGDGAEKRRAALRKKLEISGDERDAAALMEGLL